MRFVFYIFWIIVIIIGVTFASLNAHTVVVDYYAGNSTLSLPLLLLITLVLGAILGILAMIPIMLKNKQATRRLKHKVKQIEQEVNNLRSIPIKEAH